MRLPRRRDPAMKTFTPAPGSPPAAVVRDWSGVVSDMLGAAWKLRVSGPDLVRTTHSGLRPSISFQSNRHNRTDESVEIFTMVSIRSGRLAEWRKANNTAVVNTTDSVCSNGL